jgi:penicillin G amidase
MSRKIDRCRIDGGWPRVVAVLAVIAVMATVVQAREEKLAVAGLRQPVEIVRDRWGIAHIYAQSEHDLFVAQGYSAARDRLFQLELWRRRATGTLAEIQGPRALAGDIGARLLKFRGDMNAELTHYHPRGAEIVGAFVEGINAYIEQTEREPARLPIEFRILGNKPAKWTPEIVISRHNGLYRNVTQEVEYAQLVHALGSARARELLNLHPGHPQLVPDPALDLAIISDALLENYRASRAPVRFRPEDVGTEFRAKAAGLDPIRRTVAFTEAINASSPSPVMDSDPDAQGSNNWVISGARTFSGAAVMANDPHRTLLLPSLRYWVHLTAPGWNVIGAGEPALPGVSVGHNERGAWGFTIFPIDQEDLYVYETDPADTSRYRYRDGWEAMRTVHETFAVKGAAPMAVDLKFTRHGPVISEDKGHHRAHAIRAAWLEPGGAPYLASLRVDRASNWAEFREACRFFHVPSENMVWADRDGHIGWQAVGLAPRREGWNGLLPVPGDGRFEWTGFLPVLELPHLIDPTRGWIASANQDNLPPGYPFAVSHQWTDPFRFARIEEVLGSSRRFTMMDSMQLQQDELSLPARSLVPMLRGLKPERIDTASAIRDTLLTWDFVMRKDRIQPTIYSAWERHLKLSMRDLLVPAEARRLVPPRVLSTEKLIGWLTAPDGRFGADPTAGRDALLLRSLDRAMDELIRRLGPDRNAWLYGQTRLKHVELKHPLSDAVGPELRARLDVGPMPRGGYGSTVNNTSDNDNQTDGATFRITADAGDWDRSVGTNTPGQSGDPDSRHYRDLFEPWAEGRYFPVFFSRSKVESVAEEKITLVP